MSLTIRSIRTVGVHVPMRRPLGTSARRMDVAPLVLIDLVTEEGIVGRSYIFCYVTAAIPGVESILREAERRISGQRVAPGDIATSLARHFRLLGVRGIVTMALAGLDGACWDALAVEAGVPLVALLGGTVRAVRAYNSNGLSVRDPGSGIPDPGGERQPAGLADEADELLQGGFGGVKVRLGYPTVEGDAAAVRAVRDRVGDRVAVMADYNQALTVDEALARGRALDGSGLTWIEEPIRHDDYRGAATVARACATPIQIGENFDGPLAMADAVAMSACDFVMPDFGRIGGVTGWMEAASLAQAAGLPMSSHLYPEVSAHLLAATPTCHWLEYVDWAAPVLKQPIQIRDGFAVISGEPGTGLDWDEAAVNKYRATALSSPLGT